MCLSRALLRECKKRDFSIVWSREKVSKESVLPVLAVVLLSNYFSPLWGQEDPRCSRRYHPQEVVMRREGKFITNAAAKALQTLQHPAPTALSSSPEEMQTPSLPSSPSAQMTGG